MKDRFRYKGPVLLRRGQVDASTTDQRLLDSRGPSDWVHTDPWRSVTESTVDAGAPGGSGQFHS